MIEKCANPACTATFRRLREGRVFIKEIEADPTSDATRQPRQTHYYWLCDSCSHTTTVIVEKRKGIRVVPLPTSVTPAQVAS
jgi:hypothetical protein